uniref:Uncharacterized protein n=1 Tax=Rhizophora mucronata TaxID=61149 RepID=A0A2P2QGD1_RHIMU
MIHRLYATLFSLLVILLLIGQLTENSNCAKHYPLTNVFI